MKRFCVLLVASLLTACGVISPTPSVQVNPASATLGTGDAQPFTATLSSGTADDFTWTNRTDGSEGTLSATRGSTVTYTAPDTVGDYSFTVGALGVEARSAVVNVSVLRKLLGNPDPTVPVNGAADKTLAPGQTKRFIVEIPTQLTQSLLYFEIGTGDADDNAVTLVVKDASQTIVAASNNPRFFSRSSSGNILEAQGISTNVICRGACVIVRNPGQSRYVLELTATKDVTFDLFAFDDPFTDTLEPNDSVCKTAADNGNTPVFEGAIETLDDVDCFQSAVNVTGVTLSNANILNPVIPLRAEIRRADNDELLTTLELTPGGATSVSETRNFGVAVKVLVRGIDRAGPNDTSRYTLSLQQ
jgi:hypothetical protein